MEELESKPTKNTPHRKAMLAHASKLLSKRTRDEGFELLLSDLKEAGATNEGIQSIREMRSVYVEVIKDEAYYTFADRIVLGSLLAINIIILQVLISLSKPDLSFAIALIALSISIPTAAGYLFTSIMQEKFNIRVFVGRIFIKIFSTMAFVSELSGLIGIIAAVWHVWWPAGLLFLLIVFPVGVVCLLYLLFVRMVVVKRNKSSIMQAIISENSDWQATCSLINNTRK